MREDKDKVPEDFPEMRVQGRIYSKGGTPYIPYYNTRDVWKWFKKHALGQH